MLIFLPVVQALAEDLIPGVPTPQVLVWFCTRVAVNLQTAFLSPPVAMAAYYLKGVVPAWDLADIYNGMMQFMVLQCIGLLVVLFFPEIALWIPRVIFGS